MSSHDRAATPGTVVSRSRRPSLDRLIRIGETHVGRGVFARRAIKAGIVLGEVHGEHLDDHPADSSYVMELPSGRLLDPAAPLRFVNHSCDPNCELFYWEGDAENPQEDRLWMQTIRPIAAGAELSIDYSWPADAAIPCRCGTPQCRGWIVDPAELHLMPPGSQPPAASET
jgi:hypothetical protein